MSRTYAQIRSKALEILRSSHHYRGDFAGFLEAAENSYAQEHAHHVQADTSHPARYGTYMVLTVAEKTLLVEVFWDLFREGIITLGVNDEHPDFPWFHVSERGKKRLETTS